MPYAPPKVIPLFGEGEEPTAISIVLGPFVMVVAGVEGAVAAGVVAVEAVVAAVGEYYYYYSHTQTQTE